MDFDEAVDSAPAGWRQFTIEDVDRLPPAIRAHELARVPPGQTDERIVRGLFWTLVYHLAPEKWDELAGSEPISPQTIAELPTNVGVALDLGAGSGRLTRHLLARARTVVAVEPSAPLRAMLARRYPEAFEVSGWAEALPLADACSHLTAACGAFGPDPLILDELRRVTTRGGTVALINPEHAEWFEAHGWVRHTAPAIAAPPHPQWIDEFFGPPDPPHELVTLRID